MGKKLFIALVLISIAFFFYWSMGTEKRISNCIDKLIADNNLQNITSKTQNRGKFPILEGELTKEQHKHLISQIQQTCDVAEVQDFIKVVENEAPLFAELNIQIDSFNHIIYLRGVVNDKREHDDIIENVMAVSPDYTLSHQIYIDDRVKKIEFAENIALLIPAISEIKYSDITVSENQVILKGLIRDKIRFDETMSQLNELLADNFEIINQLELGIETEIEIENLEFEKPELPELDFRNN